MHKHRVSRKSTFTTSQNYQCFNIFGWTCILLQLTFAPEIFFRLQNTPNGTTYRARKTILFRIGKIVIKYLWIIMLCKWMNKGGEGKTVVILSSDSKDWNRSLLTFRMHALWLTSRHIFLFYPSASEATMNVIHIFVQYIKWHAV